MKRNELFSNKKNTLSHDTLTIPVNNVRWLSTPVDDIVSGYKVTKIGFAETQRFDQTLLTK